MTLYPRPSGRPESMTGSATENGSRAEMPCGHLWTTPVDNLPPRARDSTPFVVKDKNSLTTRQLVDNLVLGTDLLDARIEALEVQLATILGILDKPLSPTESLETLRRLREEMP